MQGTIFKDENNRKLIATAFATEKGVQSQKRDLNASNTLITIEVGAQTLLLTATIHFFIHNGDRNER